MNSISIIVPVMNEQDTIAPLVAQLSTALSLLQNISSSEIIFVDDGSTDNTITEIEKICARQSNVRLIIFRRNCGKSAALAAGFALASGDICVTMDGDLQDEPEELHHLVEKLREGYDLVSGWKKIRNDPLEKVIPSRVFNWVVSRLTGVKLHDFNCGYKAYRSWCVKELKLTGNLYRFLPVFVDQQGGKVTEVAVHHNPRKFGVSKFGIKRYLHGIVDLFTVILLTKFLSKPTYFFGLIAIPFLLIGLTLGGYLLGSHIYWIISGDQSFQLTIRPLLIIALGFFGFGINIFLVGLLGELILSLTSTNKTNLPTNLILKIVNNSNK